MNILTSYIECMGIRVYYSDLSVKEKITLSLHIDERNPPKEPILALFYDKIMDEVMINKVVTIQDPSDLLIWNALFLGTWGYRQEGIDFQNRILKNWNNDFTSDIQLSFDSNIYNFELNENIFPRSNWAQVTKNLLGEHWHDDKNYKFIIIYGNLPYSGSMNKRKIATYDGAYKDNFCHWMDKIKLLYKDVPVYFCSRKICTSLLKTFLEQNGVTILEGYGTNLYNELKFILYNLLFSNTKIIKENCINLPTIVIDNK